MLSLHRQVTDCILSMKPGQLEHKMGWFLWIPLNNMTKPRDTQGRVTRVSWCMCMHGYMCLQRADMTFTVLDLRIPEPPTISRESNTKAKTGIPHLLWQLYSQWVFASKEGVPTFWLKGCNSSQRHILFSPWQQMEVLIFRFKDQLHKAILCH